MVLSGNKNAGKVRLRVNLDPYCPFLKYPAQEFSAEFNEFALNTLPEDIRRQVNVVKGMPGIYLREKYIYMHTFLEAPRPTEGDDSANNNSSGQNQNQTDANGNNDTLTPQVLTSNFWGQDATREECETEQQQALTAPIKDRRAYRREQTFVLTGHPLNLDTPSFGKRTNDANEQRWEYNPVDVPQDDSETGETEAEQVSCKPLKILFPGIANRAITAEKPLHWRAEKKTELFRGEDFFLEFRKTAESTDESTFNVTGEKAERTFSDTSYSDDNNYKFIDVNYEATDDEKVIDRTDNDPPPPNNGVVTYNIDIDEQNKDTLVYALDEKSKTQFNLHIQPYILVELGSSNDSSGGDSGEDDEFLDQQKYFIMISRNAKPTFLRIKGGVSFVLGQYEGISGAELLASPRFRMTVRNHLGKIVIVFQGKENEPWIIDPVLIGKDDLPILTVPKAKIAVWSGNSAWSFNFSPLRYEEKTRFTMPGNYKQHGQLLDYQSDTRPENANGGAGPIALWQGQTRAPAINGYISPNVLGYSPKNDLVWTSEANQIENDIVSGSSSGTFSNIYFLGRALIKEKTDGETAGLINGTQINAFSRINFNIKTIRTIGNLYNIHQFVIQFALQSGGHQFTAPADATELDEGEFNIPNCKTPVLNQVKVSSNDQTRAWNDSPFNATNYVEEFSENWTTSDYFRIDHTGSIRFLVNVPPDNPRTQQEIRRAQDVEYLMSLRNRAFYITVDVIYDCQMGVPFLNNGALDFNCVSIDSTGDVDNVPCNQFGDNMFYGERAGDTSLPNVSVYAGAKAPITQIDANPNGTVEVTTTFNIGEEPAVGSTVNLSGTNGADGNYEVLSVLEISRNESAGTVVVQYTVNAPGVIQDDLVKGTAVVYAQTPANSVIVQKRLFSGICTATKLITGEGPERHLDCQLKDFMYVLENKFMLNSPFFDGMRDISAVNELLRIGMMRSSAGGLSTFMPAYILNQAAINVADSNDTVSINVPNDFGRPSVMAPYILPQSYDRLTAAYYKFPDGSKIADNIYELAKVSSKVMYFDNNGVFRFENRKFDAQFFNNSAFTGPNWYFTTRSGRKSRGNLIYKTATREEVFADVYNEIKVMTSTPTGEAYIATNLDEYGIYGNPGSTPGWLGFKKTLLKFDGIYGSRKATERMVEYLSRWFVPPKVINFECYGVPMRAGDTCRVQFKGNDPDQDYVIYNVSNSIKPRENVWWQQVEAEWLPSFGFN